MTKALRLFLKLVKFEQTVFALPFAYLGGVLAYQGIFPIHYWVWITLTMFCARTAGMALNRLIDREIDAKNPRTVNRALPKGLIPIWQVKLLVLFSLSLLFFSAYKLNLLCLFLSPVVVIMLVSYSYLKRFTYLTHLGIGLVLACAPIGGWIAIKGSITALPIVLGVGVCFWTAGFDIIYATQDLEFDQREGIHSIPATFGIRNALAISRIFHLITIISFIFTGILGKMGLFYWVGLLATILLFIYEHSLISETDLSKVNYAFFSINSLVSLILCISTIVDYF
ncbi:putative 4-hydroxybenzoate polyprenyltransferase [bacterium]|nr:putative 4-hydroxybenzoate polyprenyltransferase [bacterium]